MMRHKTGSILIGLVWAFASLTLAAGPRVPGFERHFASADSDPLRGGWLLLGELNCVACHAVDDQAGILAKQAPRLDEVGARVRAEFLREFLAKPSQADPGTTMPHVLHGASEPERRRQVESLVHFLVSTGQLSESAPVSAGVHRGRQLFHTVGCVACHDPQTEPPQSLPTSVPLTNLSRKYSIPGLTGFLRDPLHVRPAGRMPQLNLSAEEARDIACFLLRDLRIPTSMQFQYYEGSWEKLPDFSQLPVKATGGASSFDVNVGAEDHFAVRFQGKFRVEKDGQYRFFVSSDDGSRLIIDGREVLLNDGIHAVTEKDAKVPLAAGEHDFIAEYFEGGGEQELRIEYQGLGIKRQSLEFALVAPVTEPGPARLVPDPALVQQGRELFQVAGCAACHEMHADEKRLSARRVGKKLTELADGGCLAEQPRPGAPFFDLTTPQRNALRRAIAALRQGERPLQQTGDRLAHALTTFNCVACHERTGTGGVEEPRSQHFRTSQPEMGDEGRLPPTLTGVGDKLRQEWLRQVMEKGAKDRPYMLTRMPRFGSSIAGPVAASMVELDRAAVRDIHADERSMPQVPERKLKAIGRQMVGERGMSCVKCHTWGNQKASGIQAISLTTMTKRLDPDWFRQYLLNPQTYRPGTRMPAAWPNGQTPFTQILDGDAMRQIHAVWVYLLDGDEAAIPIGIGAQPIELIADKEPILYRNFLEGAGTRAIGVGYPEHANIAFDANDCRLALLWQGAFVDASMHWTGRGQGFQRPLGDNALKLCDGVPLSVLKSLDDPWPASPGHEQGIRFRGYRLDPQRRPIFLYQWNQTDIEDAIVPAVAKDGVRLRRAIQLKDSFPQNAWFRAVVANRIEERPDGWFVVDGDWRMRVSASGGKPMTRVSRSRQELLVPVASSATARTAAVEIEYAW